MPVLRPSTPDRGDRPIQVHPSRRNVVAAMLAVGGAVLTGCSPAPDEGGDEATPTSEGRRERRDSAAGSGIADLDVLRITLERTRDLATVSHAVLEGAPSRDKRVAEVDRVLGIQNAVLSRLVQAGSSPAGGTSGLIPDPTDAPGDEATTTGAVPRVKTLEQLLADCSSPEVVRTELTTVGGANIATLMSLHGTRRACIELLTQEPQTPTVSGPSGPGAITALAGLRQCLYGLQVLAARSSDQERSTYVEAIRRLRGPTRQLIELAGSAAPVAPLAYGLPCDTSTSRERRALARSLITATLESIIAGSSARAGDADSIEGTVSLMSLIASVGTTVGVPLEGFPGLAVPPLTP